MDIYKRAGKTFDYEINGDTVTFTFYAKTQIEINDKTKEFIEEKIEEWKEKYPKSHTPGPVDIDQTGQNQQITRS